MTKFAVALVTAASVVVVGGAATAAVLLLNNNGGDGEGSSDDRTPAITIGMENNGVVALKPDDLGVFMEEAWKEAASGMMDISFKNIAVSTDGVNFECSFGNPASNPYYMYYNIYTDATFEDEIYLSGLVEPGMSIESFQSKIKLDPGEYDTVLVFTQVKEDKATLCGQFMVALTLKVYDGLPDEDDEYVEWDR